MVAVKTANEEKQYCHDCQKEIKIVGKEIKNGVLLVYEKEGEKITVFKCNDCYQKSQELRNYQPCEVYSRIVGYLRPVQQWNLGKREEFRWRREYRQFQREKLVNLPYEKIPSKKVRE